MSDDEKRRAHNAKMNEQHKIRQAKKQKEFEAMRAQLDEAKDTIKQLRQQGVSKIATSCKCVAGNGTVPAEYLSSDFSITQPIKDVHCWVVQDKKVTEKLKYWETALKQRMTEMCAEGKADPIMSPLSGTRFFASLASVDKTVSQEAKGSTLGSDIVSFIRSRQECLRYALHQHILISIGNSDLACPTQNWMAHGELSFIVNPDPADEKETAEETTRCSKRQRTEKLTSTKSKWSPQQITHIDLSKGEIQLSYCADSGGSKSTLVSPKVSLDFGTIDNRHPFQDAMLRSLLGVGQHTPIPVEIEPWLYNFGCVLQSTSTLSAVILQQKIGDTIVLEGGREHAGPSTDKFRLMFFDTNSPLHLTSYYDHDTQFTRTTLLYHISKIAKEIGGGAYVDFAKQVMATALRSVADYADPTHEPWTMYKDSDKKVYKLFLQMVKCIRGTKSEAIDRNNFTDGFITQANTLVDKFFEK
jgi:hypothetical protein